MIRRDFFKGLTSILAATGLAKVASKLPQQEQVQDVKSKMPEKLEGVLVHFDEGFQFDSNFPELRLDAKTGKMYQEVGEIDDFTTLEHLRKIKEEREEAAFNHWMGIT